LSRQEVDIRYFVTSLKVSTQHLYENVYCQRGQMENLVKLHKRQLASDRMSCRSATANQVRLALHTAAFWLMHGVRAAIPQTSPLATAEFATIRSRASASNCRRVARSARRSEPSRSASCRPAHRPQGPRPEVPPTEADQPKNALHSKSSHTDPKVGADVRPLNKRAKKVGPPQRPRCHRSLDLP
jgi:hypothetical protein